MIGYKKQERILICDQKDKMLAEPPKENPTSIGISHNLSYI